MQKEWMENWNKLYQSLSKPLVEIGNLNVRTLGSIVSTGALDDLMQARKPEDFLASQTKLAGAALAESTKYIQKMAAIGFDAMTEASKIWLESVNKTSDFAKSTAKSRNE